MTIFFIGCGGAEPVAPERYKQSDTFITQIKKNVSAIASLVEIADIDHSRLAHEADSPMPPSRVIIFSDAKLESQLIKLTPLVALDLPLRILAFENEAEHFSSIIYNTFDYLESRYQLNISETSVLRNNYSEAIAAATLGITQSARARFESDTMQPDGIITIDSPFGFEETIRKVNEAVDSQGDTIHFGTVDFTANARAVGIDILPSFMVLFGGPGPGGASYVECTNTWSRCFLSETSYLAR